MDLTHVSHDENHMATTFAFTVSCERARSGIASRVLKAAHAEVARLERELSEFHVNSPIKHLNESAVGSAVTLTADGYALLERSLRLADQTQGAFHPLAKSPAEVRNARIETVLKLSPGKREVTRLHEQAHVGFGAIGKGLALDCVRLMLEAEGFRDFRLVAGGSSLVFAGYAGPGHAWEFAWSWSKDVQGVALGIPLRHYDGTPIAIGVSGVEEQGSHIVAKSASYLHRSVLVATPSAADADAYSTAVFAAGWDEAQAFFRQSVVTPALAAVDLDGSVRWNGLFQKHWGALEARENTKRLNAAFLSFAGLAAAATFSETDSYAETSETVPSAGAAASPAAAPAEGTATTGGADGDAGVDLDAMGGNSFNPYVFSRDAGWVFLPLFALFTVLIHLRNTRRMKMKPNVPQPQNSPRSTQKVLAILATLALWASIEKASATEFEKKGAAIGALLGTKSGVKNVPGFKNGYYAGNKVVFVENKVYEPNCSHTWAISMDKATGKVADIRVLEMACTHAFPTRAASFLDQFKGKGPADVAKLEQTTTIAKATGSCILTRDAVKQAIKEWSSAKGKY